MQRLIRSILLTAVLGAFAATAVSGWAQGPEDLEQAEMNLTLMEHRLRGEQMEAQLHHETRMRELELEAREVEIDLMRAEAGDREKNSKDEAAGVIFLVCVVANILMAIWVYTDNRNRDAGQGIWIVITLLAGFFGALVYAVIRLGDLGKDGTAFDGGEEVD